jgi:hypothetical protein
MSSLTQIINEQILTTFSLYNKKISSKFNINEDELVNLWKEINLNDSSSLSSHPLSSQQQQPHKLSESSSELNKLTVKELKEFCKNYNLPVKGTKPELIARIDEYNEKKKNKNTSSSSSSSSIPQVTNNVVKKLIEKQPTLHVMRNKYGNFIHEDTGLVLDPKTQKVYGRQLPDGRVINLTLDDINICHKYKFQYVIPENLDNNNEDEDDDEVEIDVNDEEVIDEEEVEVDDDDDNVDDEDDVEDEDEEEEEFEYEE